MKRIMLALTAALLGFWALDAQTLQSGFEASLPDSVKYFLPEFAQGRIVYKDGGFSTGTFNISTLDQTLRYIEDGKEMSLDRNLAVDRVFIGNHLFIKHLNEYLCVSESVGDVFLCVGRQFRLNDTKKGAYGSASATSNIKEVGQMEGASGELYNLKGFPNFKIVEVPYLLKDNKVSRPTRKQIRKLLPEKAGEIDSYLEGKQFNFDSFEQMLGLFQAIK